MFKFKADSAQGIKEAQIKLDNKINGEVERKAIEKDTSKHVDALGISPSNTVLTWISELNIIVKTFGMRALHNQPRKM